MYRYTLTVFFIVSLAVSAAAKPPDEVADILSRAESLYFEAKFKDAIQLLQRADELLKPRADRSPDKITIKLQLALAHVGLNEMPLAKTSLRELFAIDPEYKLDPQQFPPKVLVLADEAKAEQNEARCQAVRVDARKNLDSGNAMALVNLMQAMKPKCTGLDALEPDAAELFYKTGLDAYKKAQYSEALDRFRWALKLAPKHELAAQYYELTQSKLQLNADRFVLEWHKSVEAHELKRAALTYDQIKNSKDAPPAQTLDQMRTEYRSAVSSLVDSWNRSCAGGDAAAMESIRQQLPEHFSDPSLGEDLLGQMKTCVKKGCMQISAQLALARLRAQVNPVVPPAFQDIARRSQVTVHVKARIDEKGDVTAGEAQGASPMLNEAVRSAVDHWKFAPIMDPSGPRCAEVDIPVVLKP
jgi:tetratricopeptide (TPR) repeat protein